MSDLTLLILRIGFLLLLWLFIFSVVYALRSDLFGAPVRKLPSDAGTPAGAGPAPSAPAVPAVLAPVAVNAHTPPGALTADTALPTAAASTAPSGSAPVSPPAAAPSAAARVLAITSGIATGTTLALDEDFVTIGRSSDSDLVIVDEYTSTYHARLHRDGTQWVLTDLDSTNGTKLDGVRVTGSTPIPVFTPITIGTTTFELRP